MITKKFTLSSDRLLDGELVRELYFTVGPPVLAIGDLVGELEPPTAVGKFVGFVDSNPADGTVEGSMEGTSVGWIISSSLQRFPRTKKPPTLLQ